MTVWPSGLSLKRTLTNRNALPSQFAFWSHWHALFTILLIHTVHILISLQKWKSIDDIPRIGRVRPATFLGNELRVNICLSLVIMVLQSWKIILICRDFISNRVIFYLFIICYLLTAFLGQIQHIFRCPFVAFFK